MMGTAVGGDGLEALSRPHSTSDLGIKVTQRLPFQLSLSRCGQQGKNSKGKQVGLGYNVSKTLGSNLIILKGVHPKQFVSVCSFHKGFTQWISLLEGSSRLIIQFNEEVAMPPRYGP